MKFDHFKMLVDMMFVPDGNGGLLQRYDSVDAKTLHPLVLAYIGDAWFHLFVRGRLLSYEQAKVQALDQFSSQIVSAVWQAKAWHGIKDMLTEEEQAVFRRGRNAKSHAPRSASTGLEARLGTVYLQEKYERLYDVAEAAFQVISREMMEEIQKRR